jgi:transcriptional regulator with XRE-family HTH domain
MSSLHSDANSDSLDNGDMSLIGRRVRARRNELGLKQGDLARLVGITQPSLSLIESGDTKSLRGTTLVGLARALKTSTRWIMTGKGPHEVDPQLSAQEEELLQIFINLTDQNRKALLATGKALEGAQPPDSLEAPEE